MKNFNKIWLVALLIFVMVLSAACSSDAAPADTASDDAASTPAATDDSSNDTASNEADEETPSLPSKIVIAVDDSYPPMEYRDENNELVGFDVDFAKALSAETGIEIEFQPTAWDGIFQGLDSGRYDVIISAVSMTNDRLDNFDFTQPYLANGQVIVVTPDNDSINSAADLEGLTVGVQLSTTADEAAEKQSAETPFTIEKYDDITQTFTAMQAGRLDAIVVDAAVAMDYVSKNPDDFKITTAQLTNEPISICLKKGNTELRDALDAAIDTLKADGTLSQISNDTFGEDYTSNIDSELY